MRRIMCTACKSAHHHYSFLCHVGQLHHQKATQQGVHCTYPGPDRFCPTTLLMQETESEGNHVCSAALSHSGIWLPITRYKYKKRSMRTFFFFLFPLILVFCTF